MQIYSVDQLLREEGFAAPPMLRALNPNRDNYSVLLFQPRADVEADSLGVRHADAKFADMQFRSFLELAVDDRADLAITPEYSMPWTTLEAAVLTGTAPASGSLWILGCESTTLDELATFKERVKNAASVIHEPLTPLPNRFVNPVVYRFATTPNGSSSVGNLVIVVQFKTSPMGDKEDYEKNHLQTGDRIYYFGNGTNQIRLATLICSDAFDITDQFATDLYLRTLLIHIQLNKSPRQTQFRQYRDKFFQYHGDETEILCLNWAKGVNILCNGHRVPWIEVSGSGWYSRPDKFDSDDANIKQNHEKGLYYTWWQDSKCHAQFFSYCPAVYSITASKVAYHAAMASQARRTGPVLTFTRTWDSDASQWINCETVDDGFSSIVSACGDASGDITSLAASNPLYAERALALSAGAIPTNDWHSVQNLDSCFLDRTEVVRRVTACQDAHQDAKQFRTLRLRTAHRLLAALEGQLPVALADLSGGFKFDWSPLSPHTNIVSSSAAVDGRRATVIYLGDQHSEESAKAIIALLQCIFDSCTSTRRRRAFN